MCTALRIRTLWTASSSRRCTSHMWTALLPTMPCRRHTDHMEKSESSVCALYCRLSKEDADRREESESITNQKAILSAFAAQRGWSVYRIYVDEDMSGADGRRPAFLAMLADAAAGRFGILLCKSQSRFTRDMEAVEKYIHGSFKKWGIRFVTVTDGADTDSLGNKKARQINGLVNEWYLEDLSENVRTVLDCKRAAGQYIGSFALYGYRKDPKQHGRLQIEPETAAVVQRIYALYLSGESTRSIAVRLNIEGVDPPGARQAAHCRALTQTGAGWNKTAVARILKNEMYTGMMIQGRQRKISYKSSARVTLPASAWIRVPGTHDAIIPHEQFEAVRQQLQARTRTTAGGQPYPLSGLVYCGGCGGRMTLTTGGKSGRLRYLRCAAHCADPAACTCCSMDADALVQLVSEHISAHTAGFHSAVANMPNTLPLARLLALRTGLVRAGIGGEALCAVDARIAQEKSALRPPAESTAESIPFSRALACTLIRRISIGERCGDTQHICIEYCF